MNQEPFLPTPEIDKLGLPDPIREFFVKDFKNKKDAYGLGLIAGASGSGRSATIYALIGMLAPDSIKAFIVEDKQAYVDPPTPSRYEQPLPNDLTAMEQLEIISYESQVTTVVTSPEHSKAACVRAALRFDPDVIAISEIDNLETLNLTVRSSLTGHQVFAGVTAARACEVLPLLLRLIGTDRFLLCSTIEFVLYQQLVDGIEPERKVAYGLSESEHAQLSEVGLGNRFEVGETVWRSEGQPSAMKVAIFELIQVDQEMRLFLDQDGVDANAMLSYTKSKGIPTLLDDAINKVKLGSISIGELISLRTRLDS
jgi:type II secretory ATPase GspE/PulE/Tfp pilus assembly ATPase PilB-like protein